jgi:hypothetical protein
MEEPRLPNTLLRAALAEAGWTEDELARQVNRIGGEAGRRLRLDRRSVSHWLAGRRPRPPVPDMVAEALSRRFGRPVTVGDVGLANDLRAMDASGGRSWRQDRDPAAALIELCGPQTRSGHESEGIYSLAALEVPPWAQARREPPSMDGVADHGPRLSPGQVDAIALMTGLFAAVDDAFGGGYSRSALASYLSWEVVPRLRAHAAPALRARLLSVVTRLVFLCGYMCFDDECTTAAHAGGEVARPD